MKEFNLSEKRRPHYRPAYCKITRKLIRNAFKIRKDCLKNWDGKHRSEAGKCYTCVNLGFKRWRLDKRNRLAGEKLK